MNTESCSLYICLKYIYVLMLSSSYMYKILLLNQEQAPHKCRLEIIQLYKCCTFTESKFYVLLYKI